MKGFLEKFGNWIAVGVCVLTFGLLFIPTWVFRNQDSMGYVLIFRASSYLYNNNLGRPSAAGIIALILTLLALICFIFARKSSGLKMVGGYLLLISGILFVTMQGWVILIYTTVMSDGNVIGWPIYLIAVLQIIAALIMIVLGHLEYNQEKTRMYTSSGYSYLKASQNKNKKK